MDDRGEPLAAPVRVCFVRDLGTHCHEVAAGATIERPPEPFDLLRIEGPEHGPALFRRNELRPVGEAPVVVRVPRKARLRVAAAEPAELVLSLYAPDDFRRPAHRLTIDVPGVVRIPAGRFVASLARPERSDVAPDLHQLELPPGGTSSLGYTERSGWSLVLEVVARQSPEEVASPLAGASAEIRPLAGYDAVDDDLLWRGKSGEPGGLVLVSGLEAELARATVAHPSFVPEEVLGLAAAPGSFAHARAELSPGGRLTVAVTVDGEVAAGVRCRLLRYEPGEGEGEGGSAGDASPAEVAPATETGPAGLCTFEQLPAQTLALRLEPEERDSTGRSFFETDIAIVAGQETHHEADLRRFVLSGTVEVGERPAVHYEVRVLDLQEASSFGPVKDYAAVARVDEEGEYRATLWRPGSYMVVPHTPGGAPAGGMRRLLVSGDETLDFDLAAAGIVGRVVDERGEPVPEAAVVLGWERAPEPGDIDLSFGMRGRETRGTATDADGWFELSLDGANGFATLSAEKPGYRTSETVELAVAPDRPPPPVVLELERGEPLRGRLLTAAGGPVAGGWVAAVGDGRIADAARSGGDGTFELRASGGSVPGGGGELWASGPSCPLARHDTTTGTDLALRCPQGAATLVLRFVDSNDRPVEPGEILVEASSGVIPARVLAGHLTLLGLPSGPTAGRLVLPHLAPGAYRLFLAAGAAPSTVTAGLDHGLLASVGLAPGEVAEYRVVIEAGAGGG